MGRVHRVRQMTLLIHFCLVYIRRESLTRPLRLQRDDATQKRNIWQKQTHMNLVILRNSHIIFQPRDTKSRWQSTKTLPEASKHFLKCVFQVAVQSSVSSTFPILDSPKHRKCLKLIESTPVWADIVNESERYPFKPANSMLKIERQGHIDNYWWNSSSVGTDRPLPSVALYHLDLRSDKNQCEVVEKFLTLNI